ncbi:helix-turn-helix domain-containing protein [Nocardioides sp. zg-536]|uniref:Helix-turn-helix domain-containing protein n=1 Tax=Nocardioides faecalis TaxID=2803858 RepID=A0A938Y5J3_9ACTN|nr:helix-turn-helix domain-containing protein [Nocardioides faecalis]MBM9458648.1 helix-turn-helix domain-containing protein [Nocardioides faecalis]MBS4752980.1 helix-turn-helix domain-containing protein [Nocardioides faecalis]QVI58643.1 helix-turn-helix domain-containing protein [Nocardioides faecalis]
MSEARPAPGAQTLARGLRALESIAVAPDGLSILELAEMLGVHRSIASRLLATLAEFRMVIRGADGRYRVGSGLAALASGIHSTLRVAAEPVLRELAESLGATIALLVAEGEEAVALSVVAPAQTTYHLSFRAGGRHPLDRAAGGVALLAGMPPRPGEPARVAEARERGYALTFAEVEPGAYGVGVPIPAVPGMPTACVNLITHREEIARTSPPALVAAAARIAASLS